MKKRKRLIYTEPYTQIDSKVGIWAVPKPRGSTIANRSILIQYGPVCDRRTAGAFASAQIPIFDSRSVYFMWDSSRVAFPFSLFELLS